MTVKTPKLNADQVRKLIVHKGEDGKPDMKFFVQPDDESPADYLARLISMRDTFVETLDEYKAAGTEFNRQLKLARKAFPKFDVLLPTREYRTTKEEDTESVFSNLRL